MSHIWVYNCDGAFQISEIVFARIFEFGFTLGALAWNWLVCWWPIACNLVLDDPIGTSNEDTICIESTCGVNTRVKIEVLKLITLRIFDSVVAVATIGRSWRLALIVDSPRACLMNVNTWRFHAVAVAVRS